MEHHKLYASLALGMVAVVVGFAGFSGQIGERLASLDSKVTNLSAQIQASLDSQVNIAETQTADMMASIYGGSQSQPKPLVSVGVGTTLFAPGSFVDIQHMKSDPLQLTWKIDNAQDTATFVRWALIINSRTYYLSGFLPIGTFSSRFVIPTSIPYGFGSLRLDIFNSQKNLLSSLNSSQSGNIGFNSSVSFSLLPNKFSVTSATPTSIIPIKSGSGINLGTYNVRETGIYPIDGFSSKPAVKVNSVQVRTGQGVTGNFRNLQARIFFVTYLNGQTDTIASSNIIASPTSNNAYLLSFLNSTSSVVARKGYFYVGLFADVPTSSTFSNIKPFGFGGCEIASSNQKSFCGSLTSFPIWGGTYSLSR